MLAAATQRIIRAGRRGHRPAGAGALPDCGGALCQGPTPGSAAACKEQPPLLLLPLPPTFATTSSSPGWPRPGSVNTRRNLLRKGLEKGGEARRERGLILQILVGQGSRRSCSRCR